MMEYIRDCCATIVHVAEVVRTIFKLVFRLDKAKQNHKMCLVSTALIYVYAYCNIICAPKMECTPNRLLKAVF